MKLTAAQRVVFNLLQDGKPHGKRELRLRLGDEWTDDNSLRVCIHNLRFKIRKQGLEIICRASAYQLVRLLHSSYDGKR